MKTSIKTCFKGELVAQRAEVQARLDKAMVALQRYSQIKGVRHSDIAKASIVPAMLKKTLDSIDAAILNTHIGM